VNEHERPEQREDRLSAEELSELEREIAKMKQTAVPAFAPVYRTQQVNAPVVLYTGPVEYRAEGAIVKGTGTVRLTWTPRPKLEFGLTSEFRIGPIFGWDGAIRLTDLKLDASARLTSGEGFLEEERGEAGEKLVGVVGPVDSRASSDPKLSRVRFHVTNFLDVGGAPLQTDTGELWQGRTEIEASDWRITLDSLPNERELQEQLDVL